MKGKNIFKRTTAVLIGIMVVFGFSVLPFSPGIAVADHGATHPPLETSTCRGIIDLSTGTTNNFIAQSPGTLEDAIADPLDWDIERDTYVVSAFPGWYNGPEVGSIANWITPFTNAANTSASGFGDFNATITFSAPSPGVVTLYVAADDAVDIDLDGVPIGSHTTFKTLKKITANVTPGSHTIKAVVDDTHGVVSGLLVIGWYCPIVVDVDIDIKPGSFPNSINLKSKGTIPVAILGSWIDVTTIDQSSIRFGPASAEPVANKKSLEDVDGDGQLDLVLHFKTKETGIKKGDTEATLTGKTTDGIDFSGTDSVRTVPSH